MFSTAPTANYSGRANFVGTQRFFHKSYYKIKLKGARNTKIYNVNNMSRSFPRIDKALCKPFAFAYMRASARLSASTSN